KAATPLVTPQAQPQTQPATPPTTQPAQRVRHAEVEAMISQLRHDDADVSRDAATALGALGHVEAVEPLIQVMENRDGYFHPVVRRAAVLALASFRNEQVTSLLTTISKDQSQDTAIRDAAAQVLSR